MRKLTKEQLLKKGFLPRTAAAKRLRVIAQGIEEGTPSLMIRPPEKDPDLWIRVNVTGMDFDHPKEEKQEKS